MSYDCDVCPAYCCSYPRVILTKKDMKRLARHFGVGLAEARKRFTKKGAENGERVLRHRKDHIYKSVCRFLDRESRECTIYEARQSSPQRSVAVRRRLVGGGEGDEMSPEPSCATEPVRARPMPTRRASRLSWCGRSGAFVPTTAMTDPPGVATSSGRRG